VSVSRRGGLGRGLAALIPPGEAAEGTRATLAQVPVEAVVPNPRQPREVFDDDELDGLAVSIRDMGVLQPIVVRPLEGDRFELIAGERRLRASKRAGLASVPAVVRHTEDGDLLKEALVENIHRVQLNPLEEAAAYQQLLDEFDFTQEELAAKLGRSRPAISNTIRLLGLPPAVQRRVAAGVLSAGHAKALLAIPDASAQERLAERIVQEGMSVRATEELVRVRLLDDEAHPEPAPPPRRKVVAPGLVDLQDDLSDALLARVRISMGPRKGRLQIEFGSVDDLERIVGVIAKGLEGAPGAAELAATDLGAQADTAADLPPPGDERPDVGVGDLDERLDELDQQLADLDDAELDALTRPDAG
jgi:ParB family transcriptional regulator, chromosome partitioning protein